MPFQFYFLVFDGPEECDWKPFGTKIGALVEPTRKRDQYDYGHNIDIDLSIVCRDPAKVNNESLPRVLGFFIPARYLENDEFEAFLQRFIEVVNRLAPYSESVEKHGLSLNYILKDEFKLPNNENMKRLHKELSLRLDHNVPIRHDFVRKEHRFDEIISSSLTEMTINKRLQPLFKQG
jgi:hypothetical protein